MVYVSDEILDKIEKKLKINTNVVSKKTLREALLVELEHGRRFKKYGLNVTNDNILTTAKIAMAHIAEYPDYYSRLSKLEESAKKYWTTKEKKPVFN